MKESSTIKNLVWNDDRLTVEFKSGSTYIFEAVPKQVYDEFMLAESLGKFFASKVRGKFDVMKIAHEAHVAPEEGYPFPTGPKPGAGQLSSWENEGGAQAQPTDAAGDSPRISDTDYTTCLEWTQEEEDEFMKIMNDKHDGDE
jgi:hypothetical protein